MDWIETLRSQISPSILSLLVSAGLGLIIGLEREMNTHDKPGHFGGIRTFALVSTMGGMAGILNLSYGAGMLLMAFGSLALLIAASHFSQANQGHFGLTSETALLMTFMLGAIAASGFVQEALVATVITATALSLKDRLHGLARQVTEQELFALIKFIVLALLLLPALPTEAIGPDGLFSPRGLGYIAILVLSMTFAGYLLLKYTSAEKGILLTAAVGGMISSTLVTWVFSSKSRERPDLAPAYGTGIALASSIMFVRVLVLVAIFALSLAKMLAVPLLLMFAACLLPIWRVLKGRESAEGDAPKLDPGNPLDIKNALFFVALYVGISLFMWASRQWLGHSLTYVSGALAGIAEMDIISISTAKWAAVTDGANVEAARIILLAALSNTFFKWAIAFFNGSDKLRPPILKAFGAVAIVGAAWLAVLFFQ